MIITIANAKILISFIGGLALFIYGMQVMGEGLQNAAGQKMQSLLNVLTTNRFMGVLTGALITMVIQSSSATTVMVVGFVNAGLMSLTQSVGVIMGANIGTTVTSWIVSAGEWSEFLKPTTIAPFSVAVGVVMMMASKKQKTKMIGNILVGFGILFMGMTIMGDAVKPFKDSEVFVKGFTTLGSSPILGLLVGAGVTCILQSSSASVGILQSLAGAGLVPWSAAVYIILGQNIGTCITAILSSIGTTKNAKAASYIHLLFNVIGSAVFLVIAVAYFTVINPALAGQYLDMTDISQIHTSFNIGATILLFPFANVLVKLASKMAGIEESGDLVVVKDESEVRLDDRLLENPAFAKGASFKEVLRMGEICKSSVISTKKAVIEGDKKSIDEIFKYETEIDSLEHALSDYMTKIIRMNLTDLDRNDVAGYFHIISDFERIGDHCENIAELSEYLLNENAKFSSIAKEELNNLIDTTIECCNYCLQSLADDNIEDAKEAIQLEDDIDILVKNYRNNHVDRLSSENCNAKAGIVFLDLLANFERVSDHAKNISQFVLTRNMKN